MKRFFIKLIISYFAIAIILVLLTLDYRHPVESFDWSLFPFLVFGSAIFAFIPAILFSLASNLPKNINLNPIKPEGGSFNNVPSPIIIIGSICIVWYLLHFFLPKVPTSGDSLNGLNELPAYLAFHGFFITVLVVSIIGIIIKKINK